MDKEIRNNLLITAGLLLKDHVNKEKAKKALITAGAAGVLYAERKLTQLEEQRRAGILEKHPEIAFQGEKVVALEDYSLLTSGIRKGSVYTVFDVYEGGEYYRLKEFGSEYDPYLGEYTAPFYPTRIFKKIDSSEEEKT